MSTKSPLSVPYLDRFAGIARLYGQASLESFAAARVAVIGIGGVGSWTAEALARSGVGSITLIDLDDICISNTNRQIHTLTNTFGHLKAEVMANRIITINPECQVSCIAKFVTEKSAATLLNNNFDYVIDAIDGVRHKSAIIAYCQRNKIKLITLGGAGGLTDPTQIQIADLSRTYHDPLLAKVRKQLRQQYNFSSNLKRRFGIEAVFSTEQQVYPGADGQICQSKPAPGESTRLDCASGFGAATAITGSFGFVAAARVLQKLAHKQN